MTTLIHVAADLNEAPEVRCSTPLQPDRKVALHLDDLALVGTPDVLRATLVAALAAIDQATS